MRDGSPRPVRSPAEPAGGGSWPGLGGLWPGPARRLDAAPRAAGRPSGGARDRQALPGCGRGRRRWRSRPAGDFQAAGLLGLLARDLADGLSEGPHVALGIDRPVGAVTVELVFGLHGDDRAGPSGTRTMRVDVAPDLHVNVGR